MLQKYSHIKYFHNYDKTIYINTSLQFDVMFTEYMLQTTCLQT